MDLQGKTNLYSPDTWNGHILSNCLYDSIWPATNIIPDKVNVLQGKSPMDYWEGMLVGIVNEKLYAVHSNLKQSLVLW